MSEKEQTKREIEEEAGQERRKSLKEKISERVSSIQEDRERKRNEELERARADNVRLEAKDKRDTELRNLKKSNRDMRLNSNPIYRFAKSFDSGKAGRNIGRAVNEVRNFAERPSSNVVGASRKTKKGKRGSYSRQQAPRGQYFEEFERVMTYPYNPVEENLKRLYFQPKKKGTRWV
jgi:hypothetical protein